MDIRRSISPQCQVAVHGKCLGYALPYRGVVRGCRCKCHEGWRIYWIATLPEQPDVSLLCGLGRHEWCDQLIKPRRLPWRACWCECHNA
jgi:hypothetical protein